MTALKKAYAEIILNTAKESAARVMISDRKSALFHHDLFGTKEEALRLLVRMKQMIDAKTIEAEITSSNQQRKIDVLEAQLQEAEDIITDLRSELRWLRDKLERAKVVKESQARNVVNKEEEAISTQNADKELVVGSLDPNQEVADTCFSVTVDTLKNQRLLLEDECGNDEKGFDGLSVSTLKGCDACESEVDVSISNKKLELSRNGCTQRIHALERNVLERKPSPCANEEEQRITEKDSEDNLSSGKVNGLETGIWGNKRCLVLALRSRNAEVITKPSNAFGIKRSSKSCKSRGKRKRRWGKRKATSVRSQSQLIKPCKSQSDLPCSKTAMDNSDGEDSMETHRSVESEEVDVLNACKGLGDHLQHKRTLDTDNVGIIRNGKRSKNMENLDGISSRVNPLDHLVESCEESHVVSIIVEDDENKAHIPENETEIKPLPPLYPGITSFKTNVDPTSGYTDDTVVSANAANRSPDKDLQSRKEDALVKCKGEEDSVVPSTKMGSELVNLHSGSKVTAVVSDQISESPRADANRLLMYTFQRKRKKGSLNVNNDNSSSPGKREVKEKENSAQDPIKTTLSNEPSSKTPVVS
ncbi:unnamed protein product [Arabis nemorensis]|uniref:Uncharacterized protein n=1 Tax=Arabis nemorensis TaxID=586526 RepID=A0A565BSG6_9BRAS|nr:unnamed protein product [Arabis nemorensis]